MEVGPLSYQVNESTTKFIRASNRMIKWNDFWYDWKSTIETIAIIIVCLVWVVFVIFGRFFVNA